MTAIEIVSQNHILELVTGRGSPGLQGPPGPLGGLGYEFSTSTTDSDPGSGIIRFNHATFASVTQIYIDNEDGNANDVSGQIDTWDDVTNAVARGYLDIYKSDDATVYRKFKVTGAVTDGTGYRKVAVTPVSGGSNGTLSNVDRVAIQFRGSGADGSGAVDSVNGQSGAVVLDPDDLDDSATTNKFVTQALIDRVNELDAAVVLKGGWDASAGSFPGGGSAQEGWSYQVTVAGTVDGVAFSVNDRIIAITDDASTTTYVSNWLKADYSDLVTSIGPSNKTGAVSLAAADIETGSFADARISETSVTQYSTKKGQYEGLNSQTGTSYTLVLSDAGKVVEMNNASANTLTVPPNSSVAFPVGTFLIVAQMGAGTTTIAEGSGVTILSGGDLLDISAQYQEVALRKRDTDEWTLVGSLA